MMKLVKYDNDGILAVVFYTAKEYYIIINSPERFKICGCRISKIIDVEYEYFHNSCEAQIVFNQQRYLNLAPIVEKQLIAWQKKMSLYIQIEKYAHHLAQELIPMISLTENRTKNFQFFASRNSLRDRLKKGLISQKEYQSLLKSIKTALHHEKITQENMIRKIIRNKLLPIIPIVEYKLEIYRYNGDNIEDFVYSILKKKLALY